MADSGAADRTGGSVASEKNGLEEEVFHMIESNSEGENDRGHKEVEKSEANSKLSESKISSLTEGLSEVKGGLVSNEDSADSSPDESKEAPENCVTLSCDDESLGPEDQERDMDNIPETDEFAAVKGFVNLVVFNEGYYSEEEEDSDGSQSSPGKKTNDQEMDLEDGTYQPDNGSEISGVGEKEAEVDLSGSEAKGSEGGRGRPLKKKKSGVKPALKCSYCNFSTLRREQFRRHVLSHPDQNLFTRLTPSEFQNVVKKCSECDYMTTRRDHLKQHIERHHQSTAKERYRCSCRFTTLYLKDLDHHIAVNGGPPEHTILIGVTPTIKRRKRKSNLANNSDINERMTNISTYKCSDCGYITGRADHYEGHLARHRRKKMKAAELRRIVEEMKKASEERSRRRGAPSSLPSHQLKITSEEPSHQLEIQSEEPSHLLEIKLEEPSEQLEIKSEEKDEEQEIMESPPVRTSKRRSGGLRCDDCGFIAYRPDALRSHQLVHTSEETTNPFTVCEKASPLDNSSISPDNDKSPKTPIGLLRIKTCEDCGYTSPRTDHFKRHRLIHLRNSQYESLDPSDLIEEDQIKTEGESEADNDHSGETESLDPSDLIEEDQIKTEGESEADNDHSGETDQSLPEAAENSSEGTENQDQNYFRELGLHRILKASSVDNNVIINEKNKKGKKKTKSAGKKGRRRAGPVVCEECGYQTERMDHFRRHMMRHTGEKPYACPDCDYRASAAFHLKRHMSVHSGLRPYGCPHCPYQAARQQALNDHLRSRHTREKPFVCDLCDFVSSTRDTFRVHMKLHESREESLTCGICDFKTMTKTGLINHISDSHGSKRRAAGPRKARKRNKRNSEKELSTVFIVPRNSAEESLD